MALIGRFHISTLSELELALRNLPSNLSKLSDMHSCRSVDFFDDENIFTSGGRYFEDGERIADFRTRILLLLSSLFPADETEASSIRLLGQGSFNIVVGVDVEPKRSQGDGSKPSDKVSKFFGTPPRPQRFALRIPVECYFGFEVPFASDSMGNFDQDVANLQVVGERLDLPIPKILEKDSTSHNPLERPYMLQNHIAGESLVLVWHRLNLEQKISAIQAITKMVEKIASVTTPAAGNVDFSNLACTSKSISLNEFLIPSKEQRAEGSLPDLCKASEQTPLDFLMRCCKRWIRYEDTMEINRTPLWHKVMDILQTLEVKGWLGDCFHLVHGDLFPRNILVEVVSDTVVKVAGIVDWDMACFAPKFVALRGPIWAWNGIEFDKSNEDRANTGAYGKDGKAIKEAFLNTASPEYTTMALAEKAIVARKIFRIATHGLRTSKDQDLAIELVAQWHKHHPALSKDFIAL